MVYLLYKGIQDTFLTENPDFTCFKTVVTRDTESVTRGYDIPFDNPISETLICTLPRNGDYIERMTLKIIVPQLTNPSETFWSYNQPGISGKFIRGFDSSNVQVFSIQVIYDFGTTNILNGWNISNSVALSTMSNFFQFCSNTQVSYIVFDSQQLATMWGFKYNPIYLYGGFIRFNIYKFFSVTIPDTIPTDAFSSGTTPVQVSNWFYFTGTIQASFNGVTSLVTISFTGPNSFSYGTLNMAPPGNFSDFSFNSVSYDPISSIVTLVPCVMNGVNGFYTTPVIKYTWNPLIMSTVTLASGGYLTVNSIQVNNCMSTYSNGVYTVKSMDLLFGDVTVKYSPALGPSTTYSNSFSSDVTFEQSGWTQGNPYGVNYSYTNNIIEKFIETVSMYIGGQLIQQFDPFYIRYVKESTYSYKNRPVLDLVENGDTCIINSNRIFYYELPFIPIPIHALTKHDVQLRVKTKPYSFTSSLIVHYDSFNVQLPTEYDLSIIQCAYFTNTLDSRGIIHKFIFQENTDFSLELNGEKYCDSEYTIVSSYENDFNIPVQSNTCTIKGTLNTSRFRYQKSLSNVYTETMNILKIKNGISGLMYDMSETSLWPVTNTPSNTSSLYLFDLLKNSLQNMSCFYSMRLVNRSYNGPIIRLLCQGIEDDFYSDSTQSYLRNSKGVSVDVWSNGTPIFVTIWYDQTFNKNNAVSYGPTLSKQSDGRWAIYFSNKKTLSYTDIYNSSNNWMQITTPVSAQQIIINIKPDGISPRTITYNSNNHLQEEDHIVSTVSGKGLAISNIPVNNYPYGDLDSGAAVYLSTEPYQYNSGLYPSFPLIYWFSPWWNTYVETNTNTRRLTDKVWNNLVTWSSTIDTSEKFSFIGTQGSNQIISRSYNGYISEISLLTGVTLLQDYQNYYPMFQ
jgi:hypothetical protein